MDAWTMPALFATPVTMVATVIVLLIETFSFAVLAIFLLSFRRLQKKQWDLFMSLHNDANVTLPRHKKLLTFYIVMTVVIGIVSLLLYVFQPHIL